MLPFQLVDFDTTYNKCLQFYEKSFEYSTYVGATTLVGAQTMLLPALATTTAGAYSVNVRFLKTKYSIPSAITLYNAAGVMGNFSIYTQAFAYSSTKTNASIPSTAISSNGFQYIAVTASSSPATTIAQIGVFHYIAAVEL